MSCRNPAAYRLVACGLNRGAPRPATRRGQVERWLPSCRPAPICRGDLRSSNWFRGN